MPSQSLQVYSKNGKLLAGDGKPKRVVEVVVTRPTDEQRASAKLIDDFTILSHGELEPSLEDQPIEVVGEYREGISSWYYLRHESDIIRRVRNSNQTPVWL